MKRVALVLLLAIVAVLAWLLLARSPRERAPAPVAEAPAAAPAGAATSPVPLADAVPSVPGEETAPVPVVAPPTPPAKKPAARARSTAPSSAAAAVAAATATATATATAPESSTSAPTPAEPAAAPDEVTPPRPLTGAIAGVLRDGTGRPVSGIGILAVAADGEDASESMTGDDGFYLVSLLRPGRYAVFVGLESAMASRFGARGADVAEGEVTRLDLSEPANGATIRVRAVAADGAMEPAQAILLSGPPAGQSATGRLLASESIRLPELGEPRLVLTHVPPGVYTVVLLRGAGHTPVAAGAPLRVGSEREIAIDVRLPVEPVPRS
jgi:hypothetical protein